MSLWKRKQAEHLGEIKQTSLGESAPLSLSDPSSPQFDYSGIKTSKQLVNYMISLQKKKFDKTILDHLGYVTLQVHAKRLMEEQGVGQVARAVKRAADISQHPFSFKVVEKCIWKE